MKILFFSILAFLSLKGVTQVTVNYNSVVNAINSLAGEGVQISNITYSTTIPEQIAQFNCPNSYIGLNSGLVIMSGSCDLAAGSNTSDVDNTSSYNSGQSQTSTDSDLSSLANGNLYDKAIIEFDFTSNGNDVEFDFVFASEEYDEYANSQFNDVFGFFLSGPGINGTFSNNAINLAKLPSSNTNISVNTVNNTNNSQYYIGNTFSYPNAYNNRANTAFDGFTTAIKTQASIQCGQTYHIKIAIADVSDGKFDAGVFIGANTLKSDFNIGPMSYSPNPVCNGSPVNINIVGDNSYNYQWSTGQNGTGINQITPNSDINNSTVNVIATNSDGCQLTESLNLVVHSAINTPPIINGINNTGKFIYHAQANKPFCFDIFSSDTPSELVNLTFFNTNNANFSTNNSSQEAGQVCWTPQDSDIGIHQFGVTVIDNNACSPNSETFYFDIRVFCEYCPESVFYENRIPSSNPLPPVTKSGISISAGENIDPSQTNGLVETGTSNILFKAGESINLFPGFQAGANFQAIVDVNTCVDDCEDCCDSWNGFTYEPIPNVFTPNNDGDNDIWFVTDNKNPFCAYSANAFNLKIFNRWGALLYEKNSSSANCCPFISKSNPSDPVIPSINWNGKADRDVLYSWYDRFINGKENSTNGVVVNDGTYYYTLTLNGCSNQSLLNGAISVLGTSQLIIEDGEEGSLSLFNDNLNETNSKIERTTDIEEQEKLNQTEEFKIFPNPSIDKITIQSKSHQNELLTVIIYDMNGQILYENMMINEMKLSLNEFSKGTYLVTIRHNKRILHYEKVIKK